MNCVACGERYDEKGRFCPFCGVLLRLACPHCGQLNCRSRATCSRCSTPLSKPIESTPVAAPPGRPLERRQLTIMFTDLVNSTALSDQLDPEDFRVLIEAHRTAAASPIKHYDGVVARYLGDGMLIYFGYPEAHEDDPDRAVRAGLEIVDATKAMNARWVGEGQGKIAVRIGIHTGIVVVGDMVKQDVQEPMAVFGNPPSLAARLQALAQPNSVVLSGATKALLRPTVKCLPRGQTMLKGISRPVDIYMASETEGRSIGDPVASRARKVLPFVNREKELAALRLGWASAKKGVGKAFLLGGDPGIGKSRLIRALEERVVSKPFRWLVARTSPYATNSDFFAFSELFHGLLQPSDPDSVNAEGYQLLVDVLSEQGFTDANQAFGFAHLLGIEIPEAAAPSGLQPERLRDLTLGAITAWFEQKSEKEPLVLVIEDLHWADASTIETIKLLIARLASTQILMVISSRDRGAMADVEDNVETLTIERLQPDYAKALFDHVVQDVDLPEASVETLLERAAGIPLFIEELPKPVLEAGRPTGLSKGSDPITLPATLRDSLMAQLDRMGVGKVVAQTGAVLGHSFDEALMRRVYSGGHRQMEEGLEALTEAGLLIRHGTSPEATYAFKHALLAEIAYDSLLRTECRQIHRQTADALIAHFPTLTETRPELIARHYAAARDASVAFDYWMKAGKAAARRSANTEAIGHLRSAEAELETLKADDASEMDERWLALYSARAPVLIALSGWSAPQVEQTYKNILTLSEQVNVEQRDQFNAWAGLCNVHLLRGNLEATADATRRMHQIASDVGGPNLMQRWNRMTGLKSFLASRFRDAIDHFETSFALSDPGIEAHHTVARGINPHVIAYSFKAWAHWFLGEIESSDEACTAGINVAEEANHPFSIAYALCLAASLAQCRKKTLGALQQAEKALKIALEYDFAYWDGWAMVVKGWALSELGDSKSGIASLEEGITRYRATGAAQMHGYNLCLLAEGYQNMGCWQKMVGAANASIEEMRRTGIVFYQPEAYRLLGKGLSHLKSNRARPIRMHLRALRLAEKQESLPLLLQAQHSLAQETDRQWINNVVTGRVALLQDRTKNRVGMSGQKTGCK